MVESRKEAPPPARGFIGVCGGMCESVRACVPLEDVRVADARALRRRRRPAITRGTPPHFGPRPTHTCLPRFLTPSTLRSPPLHCPTRASRARRPHQPTPPAQNTPICRQEQPKRNDGRPVAADRRADRRVQGGVLAVRQGRRWCVRLGGSCAAWGGRAPLRGRLSSSSSLPRPWRRDHGIEPSLRGTPPHAQRPRTDHRSAGVGEGRPCVPDEAAEEMLRRRRADAPCVRARSPPSPTPQKNDHPPTDQTDQNTGSISTAELGTVMRSAFMNGSLVF